MVITIVANSYHALFFMLSIILHAAYSSSNHVIRNQAVVPFAAEKIRVGRDYQAVCPELEPVEQRKPEQISDRALLVWSPTSDISDIKCK